MEYRYEYSTYGTLPGWFWGVVIALFIFGVIVNWRIFTKAGRPGWESLIPIYSTYIMIKIAGKPGWWLLMLLIPLVNIYFAVWLINMISKSFGKDEGFTVGLLILGFIFWPILAFSSAKYLGPYGNPAAFAAYQEKHKFDFEQGQPQ